MSAPKASQQANATYVATTAMAVAGSIMAVLSVLDLVESYFVVRSLFADELGAPTTTRRKALETVWAEIGPTLILGLAVGGIGFLALSRARHRTDADRTRRQVLVGIAAGILLFVALGLLTLVAKIFLL